MSVGLWRLLLRMINTMRSIESIDGKLVEVLTIPMRNDDDCLEVDTDVSIRKRAGLKKLLRARLHPIENTK